MDTTIELVLQLKGHEARLDAMNKRIHKLEMPALLLKLNGHEARLDMFFKCSTYIQCLNLLLGDLRCEDCIFRVCPIFPQMVTLRP